MMIPQLLLCCRAVSPGSFLVWGRRPPETGGPPDNRPRNIQGVPQVHEKLEKWDINDHSNATVLPGPLGPAALCVAKGGVGYRHSRPFSCFAL